MVDTSGLSADQQVRSGTVLWTRSARRRRLQQIQSVFRLSSSLGPNLCPASQYGSTLLQIPAPGTENDDHNPPRIASRNLFDVAVGDDNLFKGDTLQMEPYA